MRLRLVLEPLLVAAAIVSFAVVRAQTTGPSADKPTQESSASATNPGAGPRRIGGPGPDGPPQPFPEAKLIPQPKNDEELAAAIKRLGAELVPSGRFSGSVLLAVEGKTLVNDAWGEANRETKVPNSPDTSFDIGSIGKMFTQVAILQLVEAGKVNLDDTFGKYLTNYPSRDVGNRVTIRQLLVNRSGLGDIFDRITPETRLGRELKDFLPLFADKPLEFEPGSQTRYSNAGYIVLGMVIEAASHENYYEYLKEHILQPADMKHSGFFDRTKLPPAVAHSYDQSRDVTDMHLVRGSPAGGLHASTGDLFRLINSINSGKLIKPESVKVLRELIPRPPNAPPPAKENNLMAYGIQGGAPGVSSDLVVDPTGRYTRVILSNGSPPMAMSMGATIREWVMQMPKR